MSQSASRRQRYQKGSPSRSRLELRLREPTRLEIRERALKAQKAQLIKMGLIAAPVPKEPSKWSWKNTLAIAGVPSNGTVYGHTRSDARGEIKKLLGISKKHRLPRSIEITREDSDE